MLLTSFNPCRSRASQNPERPVVIEGESYCISPCRLLLILEVPQLWISDPPPAGVIAPETFLWEVAESVRGNALSNVSESEFKVKGYRSDRHSSWQHAVISGNLDNQCALAPYLE